MLNARRYRFLLNALFTAIVACALGGCVTAGPYVTGIKNDGRGGLTFQECPLSFWEFFGGGTPALEDRPQGEYTQRQIVEVGGH